MLPTFTVFRWPTCTLLVVLLLIFCSIDNMVNKRRRMKPRVPGEEDLPTIKRDRSPDSDKPYFNDYSDSDGPRPLFEEHNSQCVWAFLRSNFVKYTEKEKLKEALEAVDKLEPEVVNYFQRADKFYGYFVDPPEDPDEDWYRRVSDAFYRDSAKVKRFLYVNAYRFWPQCKFQIFEYMQKYDEMVGLERKHRIPMRFFIRSKVTDNIFFYAIMGHVNFYESEGEVLLCHTHYYGTHMYRHLLDSPEMGPIDHKQFTVVMQTRELLSGAPFEVILAFEGMKEVNQFRRIVQGYFNAVPDDAAAELEALEIKAARSEDTESDGDNISI